MMSQRRKRSLASTSFLSPINPFLKMGLAILLVVLVLFLKSIPAIAVLVGGLLLLLFQLRIHLSLLLYGLVALTVFTLSSAWLLGDTTTAVFSALRLLALFLPAPVLALTTAPSDLIRAFQMTRLPSFLTLSLMLIWRFFPLMQQELQRIWDANQLRGIDLRRQPRYWFSGLLVPLIFQMVAYADEVTIGLQTRGYAPDEPRSNCKPLRWQWADSLFCLLAALWLGIVGYLEWGQ